MPRGTPVGFESSVEEGPGGWAVWSPHKDGDCGGCKARASDHEDGEPLMAFSCPVCEEPGCDICMPNGRGCQCLRCEDGTAQMHMIVMKKLSDTDQVEELTILHDELATEE